MSLIKPGFGISALTGKLGGSVYARNRGGLYARAWANPMETPSGDQIEKMDIWINMGTAYRSLNREQVDQWSTYADSISHQNKLGEAMRLTPQLIFTECYTNAVLAGLTPLETPSEFSDRPAITTVPTVTATSNGSDLAEFYFEDLETVAPGGAGSYVLVYSTEALRPTIRNVNNRFRLIYQQFETTSAIDIYTAWKEKFPSTAEVGWLAHLKLRVIDTNSMLGSTRVLIDQTITHV